MEFIMSKIEIDYENDLIDEQGLNPNLNFRVNRFKRFFIRNVFGRALSYLVGWTGTEAKMLQCTSAGILKVATTGVIYEYNDTKAGTSANAFSAPLVFDSMASIIEIWTNTFGMTIERSLDGIIWQDDIVLAANSYYERQVSTHSIRVKSTVADSHATYQIIGYW